MEPRKSPRIKLRNTPERPLLEEEIVNATIAFANGARLDLKDLVDPFQWSFDGITPEKIETYVGDEALMHNEERLALRGGRELRPISQIREDARSMTRDILSYYLIDPVLPEDVEGLSGFDLFPSINGRVYMRMTANGCTLDFYYTFATDLELVRLGEFLIQDSERKFGKRLCQCQLKSCGRFFLEVKPATGRPQRRYCDPEHLKEAHALNASKRMRRIRNRARGKK